VDRNNEVIRILSAFRLNGFEQLGLTFDATSDDVRTAFRKLSLLVHPDKCSHPQAKDAFEIVNAASKQLQDEDRRRELVHVLNLARGESASLLSVRSLPGCFSSLWIRHPGQAFDCWRRCQLHYDDPQQHMRKGRSLATSMALPTDRVDRNRHPRTYAQLLWLMQAHAGRGRRRGAQGPEKSGEERLSGAAGGGAARGRQGGRGGAVGEDARVPRGLEGQGARPTGEGGVAAAETHSTPQGKSLFFVQPRDLGITKSYCNRSQVAWPAGEGGVAAAEPIGAPEGECPASAVSMAWN